MNLWVARRQEDFHDYEKCPDYILNPEWACAPLELIQYSQERLVVGPYRFRGKDIEQAQQLARESNWQGLRDLSIPQRIPPHDAT